MATISAPYRFVPLSKLVVLPDWASQVGHDVPFEDGVNGELTVSLVAHTPLCVGGEQEKNGDLTIVRFHRTPDQQLAIPGTSIKGMLRNVLEISTFSRFKQVENQGLGVRDISESNNFYAKAMVSSPVNTGWLRFEDNVWKIYPCSFARIHQADLIAHFKIYYSEWTTNTSLKRAQNRYNHPNIGIYPTIRFNDSGISKNHHLVATIADDGVFSGNVIFTGQPGNYYLEKDHSKPKPAKKYEFIFYEDTEIGLEICPAVMSGFRQIHQETEEWKFWLNKQKSNLLPKGIPVFFHRNGNTIKSLGLSMMYKLAYSHSIHDAIRNTSSEHLIDTNIDMADLIFGHLNSNKAHNLRGRVGISLATLKSAAELTLAKGTVLSSPKPTYYPIYIRQDNESHYHQLMEKKVELSGWKRYQTKDYFIEDPSDPDNQKVQVRLETLAAGSQFECKIRFHNLRPVELGALLWSLDFGGKLEAKHSIGTGKPYGLGQISITLVNSRLRLNNHQPIESENNYLNACVLEFTKFMNHGLSNAGLSCTWEKSDPIVALLDYATPTHDRTSFYYISKPKEFMDIRKKENLREFISTFHQYKALQPQNPKQLFVGYMNSLNESLDQVSKLQIDLEIKNARAKEKENASPEKEAILNLEDLVEKAKTTLNDSLKKNLNTQLREIHQKYEETISEENLNQLRKLATEISGLIPNDKPLSKIIKKIMENS